MQTKIQYHFVSLHRCGRLPKVSGSVPDKPQALASKYRSELKLPISEGIGPG
jgi:hypothetical protein